MGIILFLILVLTVGYLTAHFLMDRLKSRYLLVGGLEYMLLGAMLGPSAAALYTRVMRGVGLEVEQPITLITDEILALLSPAITLGIGSLGLLAGLHLNFSKRRRHITTEHVRTSLIMHLTTGLIVGIPALALMVWYVRGLPAFTSFDAFFGAPIAELMPYVLLVVATGIVSATRPIQYAIERSGANGPVSRFAINAADISASVGILIFGLVFCINHPQIATFGRHLTSVEWLVVQITVGVLFGGLFSLFISNEDESDKLLVALLGIIVFSTGVAYFLKLSPIFINFFLGLILANSSPFRDRLREKLEQVEKPFDIGLYFFAGVAWRPTGLWWVVLLLIAAYLIARWLGKRAGSELAFRTGDQREIGVRELGTGLIAQGGLSIAMVLNFYLTFIPTPKIGTWVYANTMKQPEVMIQGVAIASHDLTGTVMTVVFASALINELVAFRTTRNLLINAGEITADATLLPADMYAPAEEHDDDAAPAADHPSTPSSASS